MNKQEIENFLEVNGINGQVYPDMDINFKTGKVKENLRVKTEKFVVENKKGFFALETTFSNQVVDTEFISEMNLLLHLVKLLNK